MKLNNEPKVVLITGAARRIGATIARHLHAQNMNVIIHYRNSKAAAERLCEELNNNRSNSAVTVQADLDQTAAIQLLSATAYAKWQRLDVLINNASSFFPTPLGEITDADWNNLINSNLKSPLFLAQAVMPYLQQAKGCIINITDIHAERPLKNYAVYCTAKAGLVMLTKALAKELAPEVRVNAVAPGSIMWPEADSELDEVIKGKIITRTALKQQGLPMDIAKAVSYLVMDADYVTGQTIVVDGGRLLNC